MEAETHGPSGHFRKVSRLLPGYRRQSRICRNGHTVFDGERSYHSTIPVQHLGAQLAVGVIDINKQVFAFKLYQAGGESATIAIRICFLTMVFIQNITNIKANINVDHHSNGTDHAFMLSSR